MGRFFPPLFDGLTAVVIYKLMMLRSCYRCSMNGEVRSDWTAVLQRTPCKKLQILPPPFLISRLLRLPTYKQRWSHLFPSMLMSIDSWWMTFASALMSLQDSRRERDLTGLFIYQIGRKETARALGKRELA